VEWGPRWGKAIREPKLSVEKRMEQRHRAMKRYTPLPWALRYASRHHCGLPLDNKMQTVSPSVSFSWW
jgi:hypothetical protein